MLRHHPHLTIFSILLAGLLITMPFSVQALDDLGEDSKESWASEKIDQDGLSPESLLSISRPVLEAEFPTRESFKLERDAKVTNPDLEKGSLQIRPFRCASDDNGLTSCLNYSALVKRPYRELRPMVMELENYAKSFKDAGVLKSELESRSPPGVEPENIVTYVRFYLLLGLDTAYYLDALLEAEKTKRDGWFGYRYMQNEKLQNDRIPFSVLKKQSGAWYVEKYGDTEDVYYVRLQAAVKYIVRFPQKDLYDNVIDRTNKIFIALGRIHPLPVKAN